MSSPRTEAGERRRLLRWSRVVRRVLLNGGYCSKPAYHAVHAVRHSQRRARIVRDAPGTGKATASADSSSVTGGSMPRSLAIARRCWAPGWRRSPFRGPTSGTKRQRNRHSRGKAATIGPQSHASAELPARHRGRRFSLFAAAGDLEPGGSSTTTDQHARAAQHAARRAPAPQQHDEAVRDGRGERAVSARWSAVSATTPRAAARPLRHRCAAPRRAGRAGLVACVGRRRGRRGSSRCR